MSFLESFRLALAGLLANRLRSALTMLGLIIGVGAVIALVSFGQGFQDYVGSTFEAIGSNLLFVVSSRPTSPDGKILRPKPLTLADAQAIANPSNVPGLMAVAPTYGVVAKLIANGNTVTEQISGITPAWQIVRDWPVSEGRFIEDVDVTAASRVAVLGTGAAKKLFEGDAVGEDLRINNIPFRVIGILQEKGGLGNEDQTVLIPITTAQTRLADSSARTTSGEYQVNAIFAKAEGDNTAALLKTRIERLLSTRHAIQFQGEEDFQVFTEDQILAIVGNITGLLTTFLALIAGISLLVGGIGVMNIMLVSVTERTREIGLRKAVGARYRDLMMQFLIESIVLCLSGGALGVLLGAAVAFLAGVFVPTLTLSITPPAVLLATGVSTVIGLFFGLYPASRAASLNPIEALRYE